MRASRGEMTRVTPGSRVAGSWYTRDFPETELVDAGKSCNPPPLLITLTPLPVSIAGMLEEL